MCINVFTCILMIYGAYNSHLFSLLNCLHKDLRFLVLKKKKKDIKYYWISSDTQ